MANKLAHLVIEGTTYDIQDEELTNKFDCMTIELSLSNDYIITATLKDGNNTTLSTATIDLPSENSIVSLGYDTTTNEIIGIYRDDTVAVPHRIRVALSNLQEKLTAGQNISITNNTVSLLGLGEASTETVIGIATLDSGGKVPSNQLPSYVDDVLEYSSLSNFPVTGESGKIYVALDDNKVYRWSGSTYVEISQGVVLGETEHTAYRGDRGKTAYDHATETKIVATASGLYKVSTTAQGHVASLTAVQKSDITSLGIPAQDTTYNSGVATEINNNNNINVKYDSDTLEVDSQNRLKVKSPSQTFNFNEAIENVNGTVNVRYKGGNWNIGRDTTTNQLTINGKFVKQVEDLDSYTDAPDGEIVEYIGETDENYTNGYFYKFHQGSSTAEYETITIPANKTYITYHFPDGTEETGYEISNEQTLEQADWLISTISSITSPDNGPYTSTTEEDWDVNLDIPKVGDLITYQSSHVGEIVSLYIRVSYANTNTYNLDFFEEIQNDYAYVSAISVQDALDRYKNLCDINNLNYGKNNYTVSFDVAGIIAIIENKHYIIKEGNGKHGYGTNYAKMLINTNGRKLILNNLNFLTHNVSTEIRKDIKYLYLKTNGEIEEPDLPIFEELHFYNNPHYNAPTTATLGTTTEEITLTVPILYNEDGTLKDIETTPSYWERIDVQPIGVQSYNDLSNKPLSVVNGEVKYTLSDGTTQLTLAQKSELATVATSGSYNDLTDKPTIPTSYNDLTDLPVIPTIIFRQWNTTE